MSQFRDILELLLNIIQRVERGLYLISILSEKYEPAVIIGKFGLTVGEMTLSRELSPLQQINSVHRREGLELTMPSTPQS